jgi:hypothetical protein
LVRDTCNKTKKVQTEQGIFGFFCGPKNGWFFGWFQSARELFFSLKFEGATIGHN